MQENTLQCILSKHINDFCWAGTKLLHSIVISHIWNVFTVSKEELQIFEYLGLNISQTMAFLCIRKNTLKRLKLRLINPIKKILNCDIPIVGKGGHTPLFWINLPFSKIPPFIEIQDVPTFHKSIRKTKVLNNSCKQFYIISTSKYLSFGRMFTKVVKCKPDITPLNVFWSILWKEAVS